MGKNAHGLGKGLGALLKDTQPSAKDKVQELSIQEIKANRYQPRTKFDAEALEELKSSIQEYGVLQPVLVRKLPNGYELIAGERRFRAAKLAGLQKIPAILREYSDLQVTEIALIENLQREDLNAIEEAKAYDRLLVDFGLTQELLSRKIGRSRSHIANFLRLLHLAPEVQESLAAEKISMGQAKPLLALEDQNLQIAAAAYIQENALSARAVETLVKQLLKNPHLLEEKDAAEATAAPAPDVFLSAAEEKLQHLFGTQVKIHSGKRKSRIEIEFYAPEDLERILEVLTEKRKSSDAQKKELLRKVSLSQKFSV